MDQNYLKNNSKKTQKKAWYWSGFMLLAGAVLGYLAPIIIQDGVGHEKYSQPLRQVIAASTNQDLGLCAEPIEYSIGTIDGRFYLTKMQVRINAVIASRIWNNVFDREIIRYNPDAELTINLIYDQRQQMSDERQRVQGMLSFSADRIRLQKRQLKELYQQFLNDKADFITRRDAYISSVSYWNNNGGILDEDRVKLEEDRSGLLSSLAELKLQIESINKKSTDLKSEISDHNKNVDLLNGLIENDDVNVGLYEEDYELDSRTITIYMFSDELDLRHTLAHEMGHALGMDHVDGDDSLMNAVFYDTQENIRLSEDDITELYAACSID